MAENRRVLVDAGAIVSFLDRREQYHAAVDGLFRELPKPFYTCESVVSEAYFLFRRSTIAQQKVIGLITSGAVVIDFSLAYEIEGVAALLKKYENVPMSLADACLVRMSEVSSGTLVFTLDSDFKIYRRNRNKLIPLIMPEGLR